MRWSSELQEAVLLRRYKRFLADVQLPDGRIVTVHCPNTGAMTGCDISGSRVWLSPSGDPKRKTPFTWELVEDPFGNRVCIHSALANTLVDEALAKGSIPGLSDYTQWRRESVLSDGSRIDFRLQNEGLPDCYVEVKSVTLHLGEGRGAFPDAVSVRAARHIDALMAEHRGGARVVLLFAVLHGGIRSLRAATDIDPYYDTVLHKAVAEGLEVRVMGANISAEGMSLDSVLSFQPG